MESFFSEQRKHIQTYLSRYLQQKEEQFKGINVFGTDTVTRLSSFAGEGKMVRGGLILLAHKMFTDDVSEDVLKAACALEIMHSSLLIHDDIMDHDEVRRGKPTLHTQYQELAKKQSLTSPHNVGQGLGICVGDIGFFLAFELLNTLSSDPDTKADIIRLFSTEMQAVGLMQMQDIYFGNLPTGEQIKLDEILSLYTYKTARYTFSLPLMTGARLAGQQQSTLTTLEKLGESLGIIFQIKDDELGIFGTEEKVGKSVGSDIREDKKTIYYYYLFQRVSDEQKERLRHIFGNNDLTPAMLSYVRDLLESTGVNEAVRAKVQELESFTLSAIEELPVEEDYKQIFYELSSYNKKRVK